TASGAFCTRSVDKAWSTSSPSARAIASTSRSDCRPRPAHGLGCSWRASRPCSSPFRRAPAGSRRSAPTRSNEKAALTSRPLQIAIVYPGDPEVRRLARRENNRFAAVFAAFAERGVHAQPAVYNLGQIGELRDQLLKV